MIRNRLERVVFDYDSFKLFVDTVRKKAEHKPPGASRARLSYRDIPPRPVIGQTSNYWSYWLLYHVEEPLRWENCMYQLLDKVLHK